MIKISLLLVLFIQLIANAQRADSTKNEERFSIHFQSTIINQSKAEFSAPYTGENSLKTEKESRTSLTTTLFLGARLWKGASFVLNPELAGGSGLSSVLGIGSATNGETFRVGSAEPKVYVARLFYRQLFALSKETTYQETDVNQVAGKRPVRYLAFTVGKICVADYFDNNTFSHDPRTQFMCWALMANGAWDYAANTRGYTPSIVLEYVTPTHELRYHFSLLPETANGSDMNWNVAKSNAHSLEYTRHYQFHGRKGAARIMLFFNTTNMGNYNQSIADNPTNPTTLSSREYGHTKYGAAINVEQEITPTLGCFFRASWNDGNNETWAFTEIDHSISAGISLSGKKWKRENDVIGLANVSSGISTPHRDYLKYGGKGFMLGDGTLNYAWENLTELFYKAALIPDKLFVSGAYQFLLNPGYNKDRQGPVNVFSVRVHARI